MSEPLQFVKLRQRDTGGWYLDFPAPAGRAYFPAGRYKAAAERLARTLDNILQTRALGQIIDPGSLEWTRLPFPGFHAKLIEAGLLPAVSEEARRPLAKLIEDFATTIKDRRGAARATLARKSLTTIANRCGFLVADDIKARPVQVMLDAMKDEGLAPHTRRRYRQIIGQFCRWLVRRDIFTVSPVEHRLEEIEGGSERQRKALSHEEAAYLIQWTRTATPRQCVGRDGAVRWCMTGEDRARLYLFAVWTGLRANEIRSVRPSWFKAIDSDDPSLIPDARATKNRKAEALPIVPELAVELRAMLRERTKGMKLGDAPIFTVPADTAQLIRDDLAGARAAWIAAGDTPAEKARRADSDFLAEQDEAGGRFDFHALRGTLATFCVVYDVPLPIAQKLLRHSDPALTANVYAKVRESHIRPHMAKIPSLWTGPAPLPLRATGTAGHTEQTGSAPKAHRANPSPMPLGAAQRRDDNDDNAISDESESLDSQGFGASTPVGAAQCSTDVQSHFRDLNPGPMLYEAGRAAPLPHSKTSHSGHAAEPPAHQKRTDSPQLDSTLAALAAAWPALHPDIRAAILRVAGLPPQ